MRVVGLGGSMRPASTSLAAAQFAVAAAADAGAQTTVFDVRALDLPTYRPGDDPTPQVREFVEATADAHAMVWASPMYHGSISGSFKNVLDWLQLLADHDPPYLTDKIVGLVATAGGTQGLQAVNTMEFIARALRAWTVPLVLPIAQSWQAFDDAGNLRDQGTGAQLRTLGSEVLRAARQISATGTCDYADHAGGTASTLRE